MMKGVQASAVPVGEELLESLFVSSTARKRHGKYPTRMAPAKSNTSPLRTGISSLQAWSRHENDMAVIANARRLINRVRPFICLVSRSFLADNFSRFVVL